MKTALSAFVYLNYPLDEAIRRIAAAGYDGVDIWGGRPHAYRRDLTAADAARLRALLAGLGLGVASFIPAQFRYPTCLCSNNDTIRQDSVAYIRRQPGHGGAAGSAGGQRLPRPHASSARPSRTAGSAWPTAWPGSASAPGSTA